MRRSGNAWNPLAVSTYPTSPESPGANRRTSPSDYSRHNLLSETMKPTPARPVADWLASQSPSSLFTTTISQAEILYGVALLPAGRRRDGLSQEAKAIF